MCVSIQISLTFHNTAREKICISRIHQKKCCTQAQKFSILLLILVQVSMIKLQDPSQMG